MEVAESDHYLIATNKMLLIP